MADEDDYGPVPYEKRRPLRKRVVEGSLQGRPMLSQPAASYKLLNRSTGKETPARATGDKVTSAAARPDPGPIRQRFAPPSIEALKRQIDEEEEERLNAFDGYNPTPPRPREGSGLRLRPQHDDINEYFSGPKWDDPRGIRRAPPYVEVVETRPVRLPPPEIVTKRKSKPYRDIGEKVVRSPPPPPPRPKPPPKVFRSKKIRFKPYTLFKWKTGAPAEFLDSDWLTEILHVVDTLRKNPEVTVRIRTSVGITIELPGDDETKREWIGATMKKRGEAVWGQIRARGIDPARIKTEPGDIGTTDDDRNVEFIYVVPAP